MSEAKWYVVHTYSGYENKVKVDIEKTIENRNLQDQILEVSVPMLEVAELKNGVEKLADKKMFPGYVLIHMIMNDDTWYVVRNTRGVTGFVGPGSKPVPLSDAEMESLGFNKTELAVDFEIGDITGYIKLQIPAGKATPAPPVGPALGQHGVNIVQFTKEFNARTADKGDLIIPVVITVYADRSFSFITKTPPAAVLLKKACKIKSGSATPNKTKVATISKEDLQKIAETKMPDLNAASLEAAMSMIAGTARSMGITVEE